MARSVSRKKSELQAKLNRMLEKRRQLTGGNENSESGTQAQPEMTEEDKKRVVEVAKKYKSLKRQMDDLNAEQLTLTQTEERLKEEERAATNTLRMAEQAAGVTGAAQTEAELQEVSEKKASADEAKAEELENISTLVKQVQEKIKSRKAELSPKVKELRQRREEYKHLEAQHAEAEREFVAHKQSYESKRSQLEKTVRGLRSDMAEKEFRYHELSALSTIKDVEVQQVASKQDELSSPERLQEQIAIDEEAQNDLKARERYLHENIGNFSAQKQMLGDLKRLLDVRQRTSSSASLGETFQVGESDVLAL